ncbi:MAG: DUF11 domain-containing protein [Planctomycetia bacterium]|nr:DUF11 domain-containing protein [Planctomycetia bacterium]
MLRRLHLVVVLVLLALGVVVTVKAQERTTLFGQIGEMFGFDGGSSRQTSSRQGYSRTRAQAAASRQNQNSRQTQSSPSSSSSRQGQGHRYGHFADSQSDKYTHRTMRERAEMQSNSSLAEEEYYEAPPAPAANVRSRAATQSTAQGRRSMPPFMQGSAARQSTANRGSTARTTDGGRTYTQPYMPSRFGGPQYTSVPQESYFDEDQYVETVPVPRSSSSARSKLGRPTSQSAPVDVQLDEDEEFVPGSRSNRSARDSSSRSSSSRSSRSAAREEDEIYEDVPSLTTGSSRRTTTGGSRRTETTGRGAEESLEMEETDDGLEIPPPVTSRQRDNAPLTRPAPTPAPTPAAKSPYEIDQPHEALDSAFRERSSPKVASPIVPVPEPESALTPTEAAPQPLPAVPAPAQSAPAPSVAKRTSPDTEGAGSKNLANVLFRSAGPSLNVETIGPKHVLVDQETVYKVLVHNSGDVAARDATVTVRVPAGVDVSHAKAGTGTAHSVPGDKHVDWTIDRLEAGARTELELTIVPRENKPLDVEVQWTSGVAVSQASIEVREARLEMAIHGPKEVDFGETALYELTFSNSGNAPAERVMVRLMPLDNSNVPDTHEIGTIAGGGRKVVEIELVARHAGQLAIRAEATAEGGLRSAIAHEVLVRRAELHVEVAGPKFRYARTVGTYDVKVHNPGTGAAKNVKVTVDLPPGAAYMAGVDGAKDDAGSVSWTVDSLAAGETKQFTMKCELGQPGSNRIQVSAAGTGDLKDTSYTTTDVEALADLALEIRDPKGPVAVGEEAEYEVKIKNRGSKAAENVDLKIFFSEGIEPVRVDGAEATIEPGQVTIQPIASVTAGEEKVIKVIAKASSPGSHIFQAALDCPALDVRLSAQETTRFYGEADASGVGAALPAEPRSSRSPAPPRAFEPTPASPAKAEPKKTEPTLAEPEEEPGSAWK